MADAPLTCKEIVELVTDYLEDSMPAQDRSRFEAHLAGCSGCTTYLEQIRQTIGLTGKLTEAQLSPEMEQALLSAFEEWKQQQEG